ncbi:glycosaminoglycan xylosylkinase [Galendromus occidentalis]|uniref:Glycosaminoglycan xylosylkinase n=1 Tax=Galendromus occidentalis TaxID=34638 RepID=A0AAJ6VWV5_9ACAR|nr:glycosaminoglycan xylosylkinase [Galendromus occidentalis]
MESNEWVLVEQLTWLQGNDFENMYSIRRLTSVTAILCLLMLLYLLSGLDNFEKQYVRSRAKTDLRRGLKVPAHKKSIPIMPSNVLEPRLLSDRVKSLVHKIRVDQQSGGARVKLIHVNMTRERILRTYEQELMASETMEQAKPPWELAGGWIEPTRHIIPPAEPQLGQVLKDLSSTKIIRADVADRGTQLKLKLTFEDGQEVFFKPQFYSRDHVIHGEPYAGADRHNGEIAAFHIGRLLGFNRCPLVAGRKVNIEELRNISTQVLERTFYREGDEWCFFGKCRYCKRSSGVCGTSGIIEGAVVLLLPKKYVLQNHRSPWQRTYRKGTYAR